MDTPICDFVREYCEGSPLRLHMPGHKGTPLLGFEHLDITEFEGADSLYEASGIIARSEENASQLFGCHTYYSAEGSSQCIRAMLYLCLLYGKAKGKKLRIAAARNVHKTFLTAVALLDLDVDWLYPENQISYLSCALSAVGLDNYLQKAEEKPVAVYITSPDYLGCISDVTALSAVCHKHDVLLMVDNAHGAYLKFLPESMHPMDLGADLCCDSAHKTLPVLTGGAYLHLSPALQDDLGAQVKQALALFGSTSPSYLILQSLDGLNPYLEKLPQILEDYLPMVETLKQKLTARGFRLYGIEPMKLTISAKAYGYTGTELAALLFEHNIVAEFSDQDYLVLMLSPALEEIALEQLERTLTRIPRKPAIVHRPPVFLPGERSMTIRKAILSQSETLPAEQCLDRILAVPTVGCPPAVPILICGERISPHALECFAYYGIRECSVVK